MVSTTQLVQYAITGITIGNIYALLALGFNIIYSATGIINFAQGEFVMLGGLVMISLVQTFHLPLIPAFLLAVAAVTLVGMLLEVAAVQRLDKSSHLTIIIITIGASILLKGIAMFVWGKDTFALPPFSRDDPIMFLGAAVIPQSLWVLGITLAAVGGIGAFFTLTITGKAMRACSINPRAASLMGIPVRRMVLLSFALSAALGAVGGIIITPISMMEYGRGTLLAVKGFAAAVLGGLGSGVGAVLAGFAIGLLESFGAGMISSGYKDAIALLVLLVVLLVRPQGILGKKEATRP
jgi:branched-chain amino acid transport system permease protein